MNENQEKFLVESHGNLDRLAHDLKVLDREPRPAVTGKPDRAVVAPMPEAVVPPSSTPAEKPKAASTVSDGSVCIDVELIDKLMNLVSELAIARNQVIESTGQHANDHELQDIATLAHK